MAETNNNNETGIVDAEIAEMKRRVQEMEEEAAKLSEMQTQVETQMNSSNEDENTKKKNTNTTQENITSTNSSNNPSQNDEVNTTTTNTTDSNSNSITKGENGNTGPNMDENSIYVGQVDYASTPEELQALFQSCGTINRVTILCDKFSGQPKGYAYIEFATKDAAESALLLNDTTFRGRQLKVSPKRLNVRGFNYGRGGHGMNGRGGRGGNGGNGMNGRGGGNGNGGRGRGRGGRGSMRGGFRGRARPYHPYY